MLLSSDRASQRPLRLLSTSLRAATGSSAEARLQTVDEVTDDGENQKEDDDNDCDDDVARHGDGGPRRFGRERSIGLELEIQVLVAPGIDCLLAIFSKCRGLASSNCRGFYLLEWRQAEVPCVKVSKSSREA